MVLVTLVVLGHSLGMLVETTAGDWVYTFVYFWHIPAFVLVTGYFSRSFRWDVPHLRSLLTTVALPYLLFEPALYFFRRALGEEQQGALWLIPHWAMWYLPVLFLWRLATPILRLHWLVLPAAVVASLVGGLWSGQVLCLARALGLLPFFVLGLHLARHGLSWLDHRWVRWLSVASLAGIFVIARSTDEWARTAFLYYDEGYADLGWQPLPAMWVRLGVMGIGLVGALSAIALVPRRGGWFSAMGAATMVVYLFHGFPVRFVEYTGWPDFAVGHPGLALVLTSLGAIGLALLLASPPVRSRLVWAVDPVGSWQRRKARVGDADVGGPQVGEAEVTRTADAAPAPGTAAPRTAILVPPDPGRHR
jgi:fucose 4-O-acetylase-like acetyltransferase